LTWIDGFGSLPVLMYNNITRINEFIRKIKIPKQMMISIIGPNRPVAAMTSITHHRSYSSTTY